MGIDIETYRCAIGSFYSVSQKFLQIRRIHHIYNASYFLSYLLTWLFSKHSLFRKFLRLHFTNIQYILILVQILLLSMDVAENPGPLSNISGSTNNSSNLSIFHLNCNSIRHKIEDLVHLVCDNDILFFTESKLDQSVSNEDIVIEDYCVDPIRKDRNSHGGGVIVYYKPHLLVTRREDIEVPVSNDEVIWVQIKFSHQLLLIALI